MKATIRTLRVGLAVVTLLTGLVTGSSSASADNEPDRTSGCHQYVCGFADGYAAGLYTAQAFLFGPGNCINGHWHFWGPGLNREFPDGCWTSNQLSPKVGGGPAGTVCAEFWAGIPGHVYNSLGRLCIPTHG